MEVFELEVLKSFRILRQDLYHMLLIFDLMV